MRNNIAIIFAAGVGVRFDGNDNLPKQFAVVNGIPILIHTLKVFENHNMIDKIYLVMLHNYMDYSKKTNGRLQYKEDC